MALQRGSTTTSPRGLTFYFVVILLGFSFVSVLFNVWHGSSSLNDVSLLEGVRNEDWKVVSSNKQKVDTASATRKKKKDVDMTNQDTRKKEKVESSINNEKLRQKVDDTTANNNQKQQQDATANASINTKKEKSPSTATNTSTFHKLAGLNCDKYGGPSQDLAQEMVYWQDIDSDNDYISPFRGETTQYMTFEPDGGGWNNIRMAMETVLAMAYATGRTLVLPPDQRYYLLDKDHDKHETQFSFKHFFHMESIANEHRKGLEIITTKEFLTRTMGKLVNGKTGKISFPPHNRTDWDGENKGVIKAQLATWLRSVTHLTIWDPEKCMAAFSSTTDAAGVERLKQYKKEIENEGGFGSWEEYVGKPNPVDAPPKVRMRENWAGRQELCIYDEEMQKAPVIHFPMDHSIEGARLLVHFYAFLFFEDWKQDLWMKRFIRDHVRYIDELQCAAARVVHALRERGKEKGKGDYFDSFHIRRGDFQYRDTRFEADVIYDVSKDQLTEGATVYVATDERNKKFFKPLADHYDLVFLDDFKHLFEDLNTNYYGMLDQLIASRGRIFFGCWFSTFSSYINRMRGYHADKMKLPGHEDGLVESYYYARKEDKMKMREFYPVKRTYHSREYPASWRGIDKGIGLLPSISKLDTKR